MELQRSSSSFGKSKRYRNYMADGMGIAASCDLIETENPSLTNNDIDQLAEDFLGVTNYTDYQSK